MYDVCVYYVRKHTCMCVGMYVCTYVSTYICTYVCIRYVCIYMYVCVRACMCVCIYIRIYVWKCNVCMHVMPEVVYVSETYLQCGFKKTSAENHLRRSHCEIFSNSQIHFYLYVYLSHYLKSRDTAHKLMPNVSFAKNTRQCILRNQ
jgi:hypothetical protein